MKKRLRPRFILKLVALLLLSACIGSWILAGLTTDNSYFGCFNTLFPSHANVETSGYFKFPPSAKNIEFDASIWLQVPCLMWVKFDFNQSDLATFLKASDIDNVSVPTQLTNGNLFAFFSEQLGSLQPQASLVGSNYLSVRRQSVIIDTSNPDKWVAYLTIEKFEQEIRPKT